MELVRVTRRDPRNAFCAPNTLSLDQIVQLKHRRFNSAGADTGLPKLDGNRHSYWNAGPASLASAVTAGRENAGMMKSLLSRSGMAKNWVPSTQRERSLGANIDPRNQIGLEVGALHSPLIRPEYGEIRFVDFAPTETLKQKHIDHPERVASMVKVDYVWCGTGSLAEIIGKTEVFDYVIASHVIEHVPNLLGWLRGLCDVMKPNAVLNLAIPDKRFTFDVNCPISTMGQMIEADILGYARPSIRQMFDHCYYAKAIQPGAMWPEPLNYSEISPYSGEIAPFLAMDQAKEIHETGHISTVIAGYSHRCHSVS